MIYIYITIVTMALQSKQHKWGHCQAVSDGLGSTTTTSTGLTSQVGVDPARTGGGNKPRA
jgi:hypothetical protein